MYKAIDAFTKLLEVLMKQILKRKLSLVFLAIQFIVTVGFIGLVWYVDMIPDKYLLIGSLVLVFLFVYTFCSQMAKRMYIAGRILAVLFCIFMGVGSGYLWKGYNTLNNMADASVKVDEISAIVLATDSAQTIDDIGDYQFGILETIGREYTDSMINSINTNLNKTVTTKSYQDIMSLVDGLYNKEVGVIIFNEAYRDLVSESYSDFDTTTKVLGNHQVETVVNTEENEGEDTAAEEEKLKESVEKPFIIYCSGIDTYGEISKTSRSDVNVLAVVNPKTAQILLVSSPRDSYVPLPQSKGMPDKLTHAGIYGVDCSIGTLEMLYDIDVDYYVRVNFSGLRDIVDALGGVEVYSDKTFTSDWGPSFKEGYNKVNGKQALAFCRERHHFGDGDHQRGRNHQHMITAIFKKATSPAVLSNFNKLMKSIEGTFETNMKSKQLRKFVKYQIDQMPDWNIESVNLVGKGGSNYSYSIPKHKQYVMYVDETSIASIKEQIQRVLDGKKIKNSDTSETSKGEATAKPEDGSSSDKNSSSSDAKTTSSAKGTSAKPASSAKGTSAAKPTSSAKGTSSDN